jgi:hypothetical protein
VNGCINPDHGAAVTCADCAKEAEAELTALNDRYMRVLGERSTWQRHMKAVYQRRYQDDLNTFGAFYAAHAMSRLVYGLARVAALASKLTPAMALTRHREYAAEVQRAGTEALDWIDRRQAAETGDATRLWDEWRAENTRLRALITATGQAMHAERAQQPGPCRCPGCNLIRDMDAVPVTGEPAATWQGVQR